MSRNFLVEVANPQSAFSMIQQWAAANGFQLNGDATQGNFRGRPRGLEGLLIGEIVGAYTVDGTRVTIQVNKDLPPGVVGQRLAQFGMRLLNSW